MEGLINLHNDIMAIIIFVLIFVFYLAAVIVLKFRVTRKGVEAHSRSLKFSEHLRAEIVWSCLPAALLLLTIGPSFLLLYSIEELIETPHFTLKAIGHQWYWHYEITDPGVRIIYESYMLPESELDPLLKPLRLLETDRRVLLPVFTDIRVLITGQDVIHSWAIPALGVKMDACPGRLNLVNLHIKKVAVFYGQCSELCGVNHSFMPIVISSFLTPSELFESDPSYDVPQMPDLLPAGFFPQPEEKAILHRPFHEWPEEFQTLFRRNERFKLQNLVVSVKK
jgi:cytochrome c oxidase subunit 2